MPLIHGFPNNFKGCRKRPVVLNGLPIFNQCSTFIPSGKSENLWFSDVFRGYRSGTLVENGLR